MHGDRMQFCRLKQSYLLGRSGNGRISLVNLTRRIYDRNTEPGVAHVKIRRAILLSQRQPYLAVLTVVNERG